MLFPESYDRSRMTDIEPFDPLEIEVVEGKAFFQHNFVDVRTTYIYAQKQDRENQLYPAAKHWRSFPNLCFQYSRRRSSVFLRTLRTKAQMAPTAHGPNYVLNGTVFLRAHCHIG